MNIVKCHMCLDTHTYSKDKIDALIKKKKYTHTHFSDVNENVVKIGAFIFVWILIWRCARVYNTDIFYKRFGRRSDKNTVLFARYTHYTVRMCTWIRVNTQIRTCIFYFVFFSCSIPLLTQKKKNKKKLEILYLLPEMRKPMLLLSINAK